MNETKRSEWGSKAGFLFAVIGSAVGLGNIWRYPYMLYSNGGGAFLVPYFIAIITAGIPLLILEYGFGHRLRGSAPLSFHRARPKAEYLGWLPAITSFMILLFYSAILGWAVNYLIFAVKGSWGADPNAFFFGDFLKLSDSPFALGTFRMPVVIGIVVIWLINWYVTFQGVSGGIEKLNLVLIPALVVLMIVVVIRGITLPGAALGLNNLFTPDWSKLADPNVWRDAYSQVFFSLSLAMGIIIVYSSYLPKDSDLNNSAFITGFANCSFEFFAAIGIFGILGFMATEQGVEISEVASGGIGLAFIVFPRVFSLMGSFGPILGFVFFLALIFSGLTSSVSLLESFTGAIIDKTGGSRKKAATIASAIGLAVSLLFATGGGLYILDIMDHFINGYVLVPIGLIECIFIGWIVGAEKIRLHNNETSVLRINKFWDISVKFIAPIVLIFILITSIIDEIRFPYEGYPIAALLVYGIGTIALILVISGLFTMKKWSKDEVNNNDYEPF